MNERLTNLTAVREVAIPVGTAPNKEGLLDGASNELATDKSKAVELLLLLGVLVAIVGSKDNQKPPKPVKR